MRAIGSPNLGEEADQLSDAAKQQLARALNKPRTPRRPRIARYGRPASGLRLPALGRNSYPRAAPGRCGSWGPGRTLWAAHARADQLARVSAVAAATGQPGPDESDPANSPEGGQTTTAQQAARPGAAEQDGGQNEAGILRGAAGAEQARLVEAVGNRTSRLDTVSPERRGAHRSSAPGPGVRPLDSTEDDIGNDPAAGQRNVTELVQAQPTGQVAPEQNLVPGDQRPVVRGYFR
jgi:hypothetical protein